MLTLLVSGEQTVQCCFAFGFGPVLWMSLCRVSYAGSASLPPRCNTRYMYSSQAGQLLSGLACVMHRFTCVVFSKQFGCTAGKLFDRRLFFSAAAMTQHAGDWEMASASRSFLALTIPLDRALIVLQSPTQSLTRRLQGACAYRHAYPNTSTDTIS